MAIYKFRSRYSEDDTSHLLVENRPREPSSLWWACLLCSARALCSSRIRVFISLVVLLAISAAGYNVSTILNFVDNQSSMQAHRQSFGYVDIPKWKWQSQKQYYKNKRANASPKSSALPTPDQVPAWYKSNLEVDFSCPEEHLVGDSWWICNPRHLNKKRGCTVYSTGPPIGLLTEKALAELLPSCEIHVFDPSNRTKPINDNSTTIQVHSWGFADTTQSLINPNNKTMDLMTIQDTKKELGHSHVDLLLLDCVGCEWRLDYGDIQQVLVRANGVQNVAWFDKQWSQYVLFHKQPVEVGEVLGGGQALSYLKLRSGFFV